MPAPYTIQLGLKYVAITAPRAAPKAVPAKRCQASVTGLMVESRITIVEIGAQ